MKYYILFIILIFPMHLFATVTLDSVEWYTQEYYNDSTGFQTIQNITVSHTARADDFFVTISGGESGNCLNRTLTNSSGESVRYYLYDNPSEKNIIMDLSAGPSSENVLSGSFVNGYGSIELEYYYAIPAGAYPPTGGFNDTVTISLYTGTLDDYTFVSSYNVQLALQVPYEINVSIVTTGGTFNAGSTALTLDFGVLTSGLERNADIVVKSNVSYKLQLFSSNGGVLRNTSQYNDTITYTCTVNGTEVVLENWQTINVAEGPPTESEGDRYHISFTIDDFWDVADGTFSDTLQISVSSQ